MSILQGNVLCAVNVGKYSGTNPHLLLTAESTLKKVFMCVTKVGKPLVDAQPSVSIEKLIQVKGSTSVANVENP